MSWCISGPGTSASSSSSSSAGVSIPVDRSSLNFTATFVVVVLVALVLVARGEATGGGLWRRSLRRGVGSSSKAFFGLGEDSFLLLVGLGVSGTVAGGGAVEVVAAGAAAGAATGAVAGAVVNGTETAGIVDSTD